MRRLRFLLTMANLAVGLFVATNPVFAAAGGNGNGNGGAGNCNGNGNKCPGAPVLPEAPVAVILPLVGLMVAGLILFVVYRRQTTRTSAAE